MVAKTGVSSAVADCVAKSVAGVTIRAGFEQDAEMLSTALLAELEACAKQYTGCPRTDDMTFDECLEFVITQFGGLNIGEIRLAFRLAASKQIDVSLEAYFGTFTVAMLGRVLAAYQDYRAEAVTKVRQIENEVEFVGISDQRRAMDLEAWEENRIKTLMLLHEPTIDNVTVYDYEFLTRRGEIKLTDEQKKAMFQRRFEQACREMWRDVDGQSAFKKKQVADEVAAAAQGKYSERLQTKMQVAGRRLAVLDWISERKNSNLTVHQ